MDTDGSGSSLRNHNLFFMRDMVLVDELKKKPDYYIRHQLIFGDDKKKSLWLVLWTFLSRLGFRCLI